MATMTMTAKPIIETAMNKIGLDNKTDDLLDMMDKIELDMNLAISREQAANGMKRPAREVLEEIKNYIYYQENENTIDILGIWNTSRGTKFEP